MASELTAAEALVSLRKELANHRDAAILENHITALEQKIEALESDAKVHWKEVADMRAETILELQERIVALERS